MSKAARTVLVPAGIYTAVKYTIYLLLAVNVVMFLRAEWQAAQHTHPGEIGLDILIEGFTQTIDTAAWVALLLLFELETFVLADALLQGRLRWVLHGIRAACYLFIIYAFYGYLLQCLELYRVTPLPAGKLCALTTAGVSVLVSLKEFVALDSGNCAALAQGAPVWQLAEAPALLVSDQATLDAARKLAWTDVINAGNWLLIVLLLEIDVRLQLKGHLQGRILKVSEGLKAALYSVLLVCALYWGYAGTFLDFWDAFLWLLAFALIELNVLEWQAETEGGM